ncbi:MAG TPA: twin-arginine translocation signal domain-containing protein, partial [Blastocatellia bacterium]
MTLSRRDLIKAGAMAGAALVTDNALAEAAQPAKSTQPIRIGVSTYSYWHFDKVKYPIEKVIENAARLGFDGVEILHRQMESEEKKYLNNLKRLAFANGLALFF